MGIGELNSNDLGNIGVEDFFIPENNKICKNLFEVFSSEEFSRGLLFLLNTLKSKKYDSNYYFIIFNKIVNGLMLSNEEIMIYNELFMNPEFMILSNKLLNGIKKNSASSKINNLDKLNDLLNYSTLIKGFNELIFYNLNNNVYYKNKIIELLSNENKSEIEILEHYIKENKGNTNWEDIYNYTKIIDGKIEGIYREGDLVVTGSNITQLKYIKYAKRILADDSELLDLGDLISVGYLSIVNTKIKSLSELQYADSIIANGSDLQDLGNLIVVSNVLDIIKTNITSLGYLTKAGEIKANNTSLKDLGNLEVVKTLNISSTYVRTLGKLLLANEIIAKNSLLIDLGNIEEIDYLDITGSQIISLGELKIANTIIANNTNLSDLGKLFSIKNLYIYNCNLDDFGNLKSGKVFANFSLFLLLKQIKKYGFKSKVSLMF